MQPIVTPMAAALEAAVSAIQRKVPDLRGHSVVIHFGSGGRQALAKYGHYGSARWTIKKGRRKAQNLGEILIVAEALNRKPEDIFETVLHECCHLLADVRGVRDCSQNGRYHNAKFKAIAEELGLVPVEMGGYGYAQTVLPRETRTLYLRSIKKIAEACKGYRAVDANAKRDKVDRNLKVAICACDPPRKLRASQSVLSGPDIICSECASPFVEQGE